MVDVSDPVSPVIRTSLPVHGYGLAYAFDEDHVFGSYAGAGDVQLFDMSDQDAPRLMAQADVGADARAMQWMGDHLLVAGFGGVYSVARHCGSTTTGVATEPPAPQANRFLASPNPCNPQTAFRFTLPAAAAVHLRVYDLAGRRVRTLAAGIPLDAGLHALAWDGRDDAGRIVPSGVYLGRLEAGGQRLTARVALVC
ncbi:MAG: FlgD immunoglobulin-like domain containing protein [Candidatus Krumholzibacteriia bacterium]